jgi:hypothetical protein
MADYKTDGVFYPDFIRPVNRLPDLIQGNSLLIVFFTKNIIAFSINLIKT